jgi:MFS family permease
MSGYFTRLGFSATQIGVLLAVMPLCSICIQPFWTRAADKMGKRKFFLVALSIAAAGSALLFYTVSKFISVLLIVLLFSIFFQALLPLCDALVVGAAERFGLDFSRIRIGGTVGYAVVVAVDGALIEIHPALQFVVAATSLVVFALVAAKLPEPAEVAEERAKTVSHGGRGVKSIFTTNQIVVVLLFAFLSYVGLGFHGTFLGRWCVELGYGQDLVGILSAVSALSEVPILLVADKLIARFGEIRLLAFACYAMSLRLVLTGSGVLPLMVAAQLLQSVSYMTVYYACVTYIARNTYPDTRAQGQSVLVMVQAGFATIIANLAGGAMADAFGTRFSFMIVAATLVAVASIVVFIVRRNGTVRVAG